MAVNFVKFERGLKTTFTTKKDAGRLDNNTLYFVYESANSTSGELYLGSKLIGGSSTAAATQLSELLDVELGNSLQEGMILHYDSLNDKWVPISMVTAMEDAKNAGANIGGADVTVGTKNSGETDAAALNRLVSSPTEGDIAIVSGAPYIYADSSNRWVSLDNPALASRISALETDVADIQSDLEAVDQKILEANHLTYRVLTVNEILNTNIVDDPNQLTRTVFLVPKEGGGTTGDVYDEYMYVSGTGFERLGTWTADLSNYVTSSQLTTQVNNLNTAISNLQSQLEDDYLTVERYEDEVGDLDDLLAFYTENNITGIDSIVDGMLDLYDRLTWAEITAS